MSFAHETCFHCISLKADVILKPHTAVGRSVVGAAAPLSNKQTGQVGGKKESLLYFRRQQAGEDAGHLSKGRLTAPHPKPSWQPVGQELFQTEVRGGCSMLKQHSQLLYFRRKIQEKNIT